MRDRAPCVVICRDKTTALHKPKPWRDAKSAALFCGAAKVQKHAGMPLHDEQVDQKPVQRTNALCHIGDQNRRLLKAKSCSLGFTQKRALHMHFAYTGPVLFLNVENYVK